MPLKNKNKKGGRKLGRRKIDKCPRGGSRSISYDQWSGEVYCAACGRYTFVGRNRELA